MAAHRSLALGSLVLLAAVTLRCGGSSGSSAATGGSGGSGAGGSGAGGSGVAGSAAAHAGAAGTSDTAGADTSGAGTGGTDSAAAGAGTDPGMDAGVTTPVIGDISDVNVIENTIALAKPHVSFTVTDDGGLAGMTVEATSTNPTNAAPGAGTCSAGTCSFDLTVTPTFVTSIDVNVVVSNPRGGSAMKGFVVNVAPRMVVNGNDTGAGSLRAATDAAQPGDVVAFAAAVTKVQLAAPIGLNRAIALNGPGPALLTVDGGGGAQVFAVSSDNVNIHGMTVTHGGSGIDVFSGHLTLDSAVVTSNTGAGLSVYASNGSTAAADVTASTFSSNGTNGAVMQVDGANSSATGYFKNCIFSGNSNGVAAVTNAAGQTAHIGLIGNNQVHDNTAYGVVVEIDNSLGAATLEVSTPTGGVANVITKNPVGVRRSGPVASGALSIVPATQVTANTTNFVPAWP